MFWLGFRVVVGELSCGCDLSSDFMYLHQKRTHIYIYRYIYVYVHVYVSVFRSCRAFVRLKREKRCKLVSYYSGRVNGSLWGTGWQQSQSHADSSSGYCHCTSKIMPQRWRSSCLFFLLFFLFIHKSPRFVPILSPTLPPIRVTESNERRESR